MKIFLVVSNEISPTVTKGINSLNLNSEVSISTSKHLNNILNKLEARDLLIVDSIDVFKSSKKLYEVLLLILKLEASFLSFGERVLLIDSGVGNKATLDFVAVCSEIESFIKNNTDISNYIVVESIFIKLLHEKFSL
ncbi:MAG: hypothetical protein E7206_04765 [Clostridium beijerinckii]|nr:hypothetical protein [Clostridium beijerinckii]